MASARSTLKVAPRAEFGSRTTRRLRGEGLVPGVVYSGGSEATAFQVSEREVRAVISEGAALFDLEIEGSKAVPVVVKEQQLHPVRGSLQHIDLQEVKLDEAIEAEVPIELEGADTAPGVKGGGVLEHVTREITVEALPTEIPDRIVADVSAMEINDTFSSPRSPPRTASPSSPRIPRRSRSSPSRRRGSRKSPSPRSRRRPSWSASAELPATAMPSGDSGDSEGE